MDNKAIPIFYACDDNFVKCTAVSIKSMMEHASRDFKYKIYILHTNITEEMMKKIHALANDNFEFSFEDVTSYLESISDKLPIRDYYSKTTYYRFFIAPMFPEYSKALYIDSDTVIQGDISELYNTDIGDSYLGACHEQAMVQVDEYGTYVEKVIGISRHSFFNAGVMLINCDMFRRHSVLEKFTEYLKIYNFVVTQDEDYLNLICKDRVFWLDQRWNTEMIGVINYPIEEAKLIHYMMVSKPWHYEDCRHGDIFWHYAKKTDFYDAIKADLDAYTDEQRKNDAISAKNLMELAIAETNKEDRFLEIIKKKRNPERVAILEKIEAYEKAGRFGEDVEEDPPGKVIMPEDIEYVKKGPIKRLKTKLAFKMARSYLNGLIKDKKMIIKEIRGIENIQNLDSGAVITCNHFNAYDSFAIQLVYDASKQKKRTFYRVIREGNYTSFPGFYGRLMRNCNTLPLSSNRKTMHKFTKGVQELLSNGHFVLIYPEQSMWWNYRKPKPLQNGAFIFAAKSMVPVLPCFITMKDTDIIDENGFPTQEYTIHVSKPIYPKHELSYRENIDLLMNENYRIWKDIYESEYQIPLTYTTDPQDP